MAYLKAAVAMTVGVYNLRSFVDCNLFQIGCLVVVRFLLTSASRSSSAVAEFFVVSICGTHCSIQPVVHNQLRCIYMLILCC